MKNLIFGILIGLTLTSLSSTAARRSFVSKSLVLMDKAFTKKLDIKADYVCGMFNKKVGGLTVDQSDDGAFIILRCTL
jgi:hypothetical protein